MATATRRLIIDPNAQIPISLNDPLTSLKDDYMQGRVRITPGAGQFPTLAERQAGLGGSDINLTPSISGSPNIAPFPLGCPQGMYQQGDVCIPSVDMIPGADKFPRVAGAVFPAGHILDVIPPSDTLKGEEFYVQCLMENEGSVEGKFHLKITIPSLNIEDETQRVRVPRFAKGLLYKRIRMPADAASLESIEAIAEISHENEEEQHLSDEPRIIDDEFEFEIPGPLAELPDEPDPLPPPCTCPTGHFYDHCGCRCVPNGTVVPQCWQDCNCPGDDECLTINGKQYCRTGDPNRIDCVTIGDKRYCTDELQPDTETPTCPTGTAFDSCACKCVGPNYPEVQCIRACNECPTGETYNFCLNRCVPISWRIHQCPPPVDMGPAPPPPPPEDIPEEELCPPGYRWSNSAQDCVPLPPPPPDPFPDFEFDCDSRRCRDEFNGSCGRECRRGDIEECLDCISTCCGHSLDRDDDDDTEPACREVVARAGNTIARAGGCSGAYARAGDTEAGNIARTSMKPTRRANYSNRVAVAYASTKCVTTTLAKLYQLSRQYSQSIKFINFNSLSTQLQRNRVDLSNNAIVWCPTDAPDSFSVMIEGQYYSPSELVDENDLRKAAITTVPRVSIDDGKSVRIAGVNFAPYESVDVTMEQRTWAVDPSDNRRRQFAGKVATKSTIARADSKGGINTSIRTFEMPSGVRGEATFSAVGTRSQKIASHKVTVA